MPRFDKKPALAFAFALFFSPAAQAVTRSPDGIGQALIFPYYTARTAERNPFNTYLSIVNTGLEAKLLRVRFREAVNGREVAGFNLFLGDRDMWTGAVVPDGRSAKLITFDHSCVDPPMQAVQGKFGTGQLSFSNAAYSGANADGGAEGRERAAEGFVEVIEMASALVGTDTWEAVRAHASGYPNNCDLVQSGSPWAALDASPPTGGLTGTLTLINVASGEDFTVTADALDRIATGSFFRAGTDPYPAFDAAEITPVSEIVSGGITYRLDWENGVDAVSSVLMATGVMNEFVMDAGTRSQTEWVLSYPTRHWYRPPAPMFATGLSGPAGLEFANREGRAATNDRCQFFGIPVCYSAFDVRSTNVMEFSSSAGARPSLLGSTNLLPGWLSDVRGFESGWATLLHIEEFPGASALVSLPGSTAYDPRTGTITPGAYTVHGLPVTGLALRTFRNGTLACNAGTTCQGNYGGSFSHRYLRSVTP